MKTVNYLAEAFKSKRLDSNTLTVMGIFYWFFIATFPLQIYFNLDLTSEISLSTIKLLLDFLSASNWSVIICFLMQSFYQFRGEKQPLVLVQMSGLVLFFNNCLVIKYHLSNGTLDFLTGLMSVISFLVVLSFNHLCLNTFTKIYLKDCVMRTNQMDQNNILWPDFKKAASANQKNQKHAA